MLNAEDLVDFADLLRTAGFKVSTQQLIAVQNLLIKLAAHGRLPNNLHELQRWLGPILCTNPREQNEFPAIFNQWLSHQGKRKPVTQESSTKKLGTIPVTYNSIIKLKRWRPILLVVLLSIAGSALFYWMWPQLFLCRIIVVAESVGGADVQLDGQKITVSESGEFTLRLKRSELPKTLRIVYPTFEPYKVVIDSVNNVPREIKLQSIKNLKTSSETPSQKPKESENPSNSALKKSENAKVITSTALSKSKPQPGYINAVVKDTNKLLIDPYRLALAFSPFGLYLFCFFVIAIYRQYFRRSILRKLSTTEQLDIRRITVKGINDWIYGKQEFRRLLQILHRHRTQITDRLDPVATVAATIQHGGFFTPIHGTSKAIPEYLALVDRLGPSDEQAQLAYSLLDRLKAGGVYIDRYQFNADPRFCRKSGELNSMVTLKELFSRHGGHALLVLSDGSGFINPYTGEIKPGVEYLQAWPERVLFSPDSETKSYTQEKLEPLEFSMTLPLNQNGLAALAHRLQNGNTLLKTLSVSRRKYPELLHQSASRWLERLEPRGEVVRQLLEQLKEYLGAEGFRWLCACAIYPLLIWDVTIFLGGRLGIAQRTHDDLLRILVSLPWFRHGSMPDWLRIQLIKLLPDTIQKQLREALLELLSTEPEPNKSVIEIDIAVGKPTSFFLRWQNQLRLATKIEVEPETSPLRDYVFLSFMAGRRIDLLSIHAPKRIQHKVMLRENKIASILGFSVLISSICFLYFWLQPFPISQRRVEIPAMIDIPGGRFQMGCVENNKNCLEDEQPVHAVTLSPFQIGAYEVTEKQFGTFINATGYQTTADKDMNYTSTYAFWDLPEADSKEWSRNCLSKNEFYANPKLIRNQAKNPLDNPPIPKVDEWKNKSKSVYQTTYNSEDKPITCISWDDAHAYLNWLSEQTHQQWRLPTEAEWEYVARAGSHTAYSWGDTEPTCDKKAANGAEFLDCKDKEPVKIGSFPPNSFGIYDMHGNVSEMTEDCWHVDYQNAPEDGSAVTECDTSNLYVLRGGSSNQINYRLRSAYRRSHVPADIDLNIGFRAVKTDKDSDFAGILWCDKISYVFCNRLNKNITKIQLVAEQFLQNLTKKF